MGKWNEKAVVKYIHIKCIWITWFINSVMLKHKMIGQITG